MLDESFDPFFDPDTGIVARLHYRTDIAKLGTTITESEALPLLGDLFSPKIELSRV